MPVSCRDCSGKYLCGHFQRRRGRENRPFRGVSCRDCTESPFERSLAAIAAEIKNLTDVGRNLILSRCTSPNAYTLSITILSWLTSSMRVESMAVQDCSPRCELSSQKEGDVWETTVSMGNSTGIKSIASSLKTGASSGHQTAVCVWPLSRLRAFSSLRIYRSILVAPPTQRILWTQACMME